MKRSSGFVDAWFFSLIVTGAVIFAASGKKLLENNDLSKSYHTVAGEITSTDFQDHDSCTYRFSKDGKTYDGYGASCGKSEIGQKVEVFYAPNDPSKSYNVNPQKIFTGNITAIVMVLILFPLATALIFAGWRRRTRRN